jgi:hypothetical protein
MAEDELVGNLPMERFVRSLEERGFRTGLDPLLLEHSVALAAKVFPG